MVLERKSSAWALLAAFALVYACKDTAPAKSDESDAGGTIGGFNTKKPDGGSAPLPCTTDPAFYDAPGDGCDNDGDGTKDNPPICDDAGEDPDAARSFARALGICTDAATKGYGLVSAKLTRGFNRAEAAAPEQHSLLPKFGNVIKPREGKRLGVLSTGFAQEFDGAPGTSFSGAQFIAEHPDATNGLPPGFPKPAKGCDQDTDTHDVIELHLELKAPKNVSGFAFDFNFYTAEWPLYLCNHYNDGFIAYVTAKSVNGGAGDNVTFDAKGNPVSVNNGFFDRCTPGINISCLANADPKVSNSKCEAGTTELGGTGFGLIEPTPLCGVTMPSTTGGATGWLFSQAPIQPEETFTIDFLIWDTHDSALDSSVLLDNFRWVRGAVQDAPVTDRPPDVR